MSEFSLNINGEKQTVNVDGDTPLLWVLHSLIGTLHSSDAAITSISRAVAPACLNLL